MKKFLKRLLLLILLLASTAQADITMRITNAGSVPVAGVAIYWSFTTAWQDHFFGSATVGADYINPGQTYTNTVSNGLDGPGFGGLDSSPYLHVTWYTNDSQIGDTSQRWFANTAVDGGTGGYKNVTSGLSTWFITQNTNVTVTITPGGLPPVTLRRRASCF